MNYTKRKIRILMAIIALLFIGCCDQSDSAINDPSTATELNLSYYQQLGNINTHSSILYSDNTRHYSHSTAMSIKEDIVEKVPSAIDFDMIYPPIYLTPPTVNSNKVNHILSWWKWNHDAVPILLTECAFVHDDNRWFFYINTELSPLLSKT